MEIGGTMVEFSFWALLSLIVLMLGIAGILNVTVSEAFNRQNNIKDSGGAMLISALIRLLCVFLIYGGIVYFVEYAF
jgi:hypothetical protein